MIEANVGRRVDVTRLLRIQDASDALLPVSAFASFLNDVNSVYIAAAPLHLARIPRHRLHYFENPTFLEKYIALGDAERYTFSREPLPLVVRDVRIGSVWVDLAVEGATTGTKLAVAWGSLWTVAKALRAGPGHLADWAAIGPTAKAKRTQAQADEAEAEVRLRNADLALARIRAAAPNLTAFVVDEHGTELRGEPPAPS
ncbi:hypothetical protein FMUAM8_30760 [Nocardia cyriacigeorgica]|nr:hypothetical protein FMUAM8_30760 [Nocardia cyriacigeorgica]